jgi:alkylhydroperoxidase family enzyme
MSDTDGWRRSRDVAAREVEILGQEPRIGRIAFEDATPAAIEISHRLTDAAGRGARYASLDEMPDFVPTMLHNPAMLRCLTDTGVQFLVHGTLPPRDRELAVLRIAWTVGAPYEWGEHVSVSRGLGVEPADVERVIAGPEVDGWNALEQALLRAVDELLADAMISDATWATLAGVYSEAQLIELPLLVGQYQAVAYLQNALRMRLSDHNVGLNAR